jgi:hypothetical protein
MKRRTVYFFGVAVPLALLLGFKLGRDRLVVRPGVVDTQHGRAFKVAWSGTSYDTGRAIYGRVVWQPGLFTPRVLESISQADCLSDETIDELINQ